MSDDIEVVDGVIDQPSVDGAFDSPKVCYINIFGDIKPISVMSSRKTVSLHFM